MKIFANVMKILTALAAVAGAVYVVATYGDQIVAWAKRMLASMPKCPTCEEADVTENVVDEAAETVEAEAAAEEAAPAEDAVTVSAEDFAPIAEESAEEPAAEKIVVEENEPVAEENDFEA